MDDLKGINAERTGKFIKELRKSHNMKQEDLGAKLFISRKSVSKWETGRACPSIDMLKRLSVILGVTVDELIAGEFTNKPKVEVKENFKFITVKNFKMIGIVILLINFVLLIGYVLFARDKSLVFRVNYEDENFSIRKGILVLSDNSYLSLGEIKTYLTTVELSEMKILLYMKDGDEDIELFDLSGVSTCTLVDGVREKLKASIKNNRIENLYLKIYYFNDYDEEISFNLNLKLKREKKSDISDEAIGEEKSKDDSDNSTLDNDFYNILEIPDSIDVGFLFEMDKNRLKNCINNFSLKLNNIEYKVDFDVTNNALNISNSRVSIKLSMDSKRLFVYDEKQYHFIVTDKNIIRDKDIEPYYNLIYKIFSNIRSNC